MLESDALVGISSNILDRALRSLCSVRIRSLGIGELAIELAAQ
jgi:hypothetical protein